MMATTRRDCQTVVSALLVPWSRSVRAVPGAAVVQGL